jgi:hypothetical protein
MDDYRVLSGLGRAIRDYGSLLPYSPLSQARNFPLWTAALKLGMSFGIGPCSSVAPQPRPPFPNPK